MCTYYDFRHVAGAQMSQNTLKGSFSCVNTLVWWHSLFAILQNRWIYWYLWKLYVNSQKWPNYTITSTLKLTDCHWKLVEITLYIGTHDIRLLWKWRRYRALNGFQKAKSIQCYTRQIMSNLSQKTNVQQKGVIGELSYNRPNRMFV